MLSEANAGFPVPCICSFHPALSLHHQLTWKVSHLLVLGCPAMPLPLLLPHLLLLSLHRAVGMRRGLEVYLGPHCDYAHQIGTPEVPQALFPSL